MKKLLSTLLYLLICLAAQTASADGITEQDILVDIPQIHTATRLQQNAFTSPATVTVIDRETILASPMTEVPMLMRLVPGFLSYNVSGNYWGVTSHGMGRDYPGDLEVTVDGRSVYEPIFSAVEWSSLGLEFDDIEAIEVVRGPNAPTQGSNAFNGAVNIITRKPLLPEDTHAEITVGDLNTHNASIRHTGQLDAVNYSFSLNYRYNDGFPAVKNPPSSNPGYDVHDSDEALHARLVTLLTPTTRDSIELQLGGGYSNLEIDDLNETEAPAGTIPRDQRNDFEMVRWTRSGKGDFETNLNIYHNRLQVDDWREVGLASTLGNLPPDAIPVFFNGEPDQILTRGAHDVLSERYEINVEQAGSLTNNLRAVWSGAGRLDRARSYYLFGTHDIVEVKDYRIAANLEYRVTPNSVVNLGSMLEYNDIVGNSISPRLAYNYALSDQDGLHLAVTRGHRNPSLLETRQFQALRFNDGVIIDAAVEGDTHLQPATIVAYEAGYFHYFSDFKNQINVKLYEETITNAPATKRISFPDYYDSRIVLRTDSEEWQVHGAELEWQWHPVEATTFQIAYAYGTLNGGDSDNDKTMPRSTFNLLWMQRLPRDFRLSADYYYQSAVTWFDSGSALQSFDRVDIKFGKTLHWGDKEATLNVIAQNIFGDYAEYNELHIFERRLFLNMQLNF